MAESGIPRPILNLVRNDLLKFHCGPLVYRTIIHWGFAKPDGIRIIDHINDLKIGEKINERKFTKWITTNEYKLNKDSFSDFDITALHDFLPILCCDKIAQTGEQEYEKQIKDPNSVESLLKEIKTFRNDVSHEYAEAVKDSHIYKMKETMRECIRAAGKLYGKDQTEIDEKVKDLDDEFHKVLHYTLHLYENRVKCIGKYIETEVPAILLERYSPHFSVPLPGSWTKKYTSDIFQFSNLAVITEGRKSKESENENIFQCTKIYNNTQNKFVVINGGPGSGKTTLMRNICQDILQTSVHESTPKYEKIEQFKIPIYIECRNEQPTNLPTFFRECLQNFLSPEDDIYEAFKTVKGVVFLIDGYDEITSTCRKLVDSIIDFCRDYNASFILSSRVDAGNNFVKKLKRMNLNCTKMLIEPISEMSEKVKFVRSYADKMDDSIDTVKLVNSFENLTAAAKEVFSSPILLALFIYLFVNDQDSVTQMKNEQSAYEAVRTSFLREMERKLKDVHVHNPRGRAKDIANVLGKFCLKFFKANKYLLDGEDYLELVAECEKLRGMGEYVDIPSLLSCILMPEHKFNISYDSSYQFMHSTLQEFFAAKYVSENLIDLQDNGTSQSQREDRQSEEVSKFLQVLELDVSHRKIDREMERYGNIIKFLMLETLANGELPKYSNIFTVLLKKYFGPKYDYQSSDYYLDLIISSDSNSEIISIVSDCMRGWEMYFLQHKRHIKPITEVMQTMKTGVVIESYFFEVINTYRIIKLLTVLEDDSKIALHFIHSCNNYQPLDGEFYSLLKNSNIRCKVTGFTACISSEKPLSIVVRVFRCNLLNISTPSFSDVSFAAFEEYEGDLFLTVKYTDDCPINGSNPITERTNLVIEHIPACGKEEIYKIVKYICPKSKEFWGIYLNHCHLTHTDTNELLKQLHGEKIRTRSGERTEVKELSVYDDKSKSLELHMVSEREGK